MTLEDVQKEAAEIINSPLAFFIRNGRLALLAVFGFVLAGIFGISSMTIESEPEIKIPIATVVTVYPGASPEDIEKLVTDELEKELKNLDDLKEITSSSSEGVSSIIVEFQASADLEESLRDVRDAVDSAKADIPNDAEDPVVTQVRADDSPIVRFVLKGNVELQYLKKHADALEDVLESIKGVNRAEINGLPEREMQVFVDKNSLQGLNLSILEVSSAINQNHIDLPAGSVLLDDLYYQASLKGQFDSAEELESLAIATRDDTVILLGDIAEVREVFGEASSQVEYYIDATGVKATAVSIDVYKNVGSDLVEIVDLAKTQVQLYQESIDTDIQFIVTNDQSDLVLKDINRLLQSAWQTILIIAITLFLALGLRESLITAFSIPVLYLIAFIGLALIGSTFNFLTFFALILSLGIVVDTSIVMIEGIYDALENDKADSKTAALHSLKTFGAPLISGSLTTIGAFLPLGLMSGIMGQYVKYIPITINITLLASLFTALMIIPAVAVFIFRNRNKEGEVQKKQKKPILFMVFEPLSRKYAGFIRVLFNSVALRSIWMFVITLFFLGTFVLLGSGLVKFQLFGSADSEFFAVQVKTPEGTALDITKDVTSSVEDYIKQVPELRRYTVVYGAGSTNKATINVEITTKEDRERSSSAISSDLRSKLKVIVNADVRIEERESGPPSGADIQVRLRSSNTKDLQNFTAIMEKTLRETNGTEDVQNDLEISPGEFHATLKRDRLEKFGVDAGTIGRILRTSIFGDKSSVINRGGEETDIVVRMDFRDETCLRDPLVRLREAKNETTVCRSNPNDVSDILNMLIPTQVGAVPLSQLIDISLQPAITTIRHYNTERTVSVKANVAEGFILADVLTELQANVDALEIPESISYSFGGENEDTNESIASLGRASLLAVIIIVAILTFQFNSFRQVILIMMTIPLAFTGVIYGLLLLRLPLSFPGLIGLTALIGIVVNDAIVLVDRMNNNRRDGMELKDAVIDACQKRLQPVLITTITTALGVIPLIFTGEIFRDLAIVVSVGITIATVFTLVVIPIMYVALEGRRGKPLFRRKKKPKQSTTYIAERNSDYMMMY